MPHDDGVHVIGSGGAPQTELADPDECRKRRLRPLIRHGLQGSCPNCFGWVLVVLGRLVRHEPADPRFDRCPKCGKRYPELAPGEKSFTDPICTPCAQAHDEADIEAAGFVPNESEMA